MSLRKSLEDALDAIPMKFSSGIYTNVKWYSEFRPMKDTREYTVYASHKHIGNIRLDFEIAMGSDKATVWSELSNVMMDLKEIESFTSRTQLDALMRGEYDSNFRKVASLL